jgi:hypothetical protein
MHGGDTMKKFIFSLVIVALLLAIAVPVLAEFGYPAPDAGNIGCSPKVWERKGYTLPDDPFTMQMYVAGLNDAANFPGDTGLSADDLVLIQADYDGAETDEEKKDIEEYVKLWNKGYLDADGKVVKTCPKDFAKPSKTK